MLLIFILLGISLVQCTFVVQMDRNASLSLLPPGLRLIRKLMSVSTAEHEFLEVELVAGNRMPRSSLILWSEEQVARQHYKRSQVDPLYPYQWHLHSHPYGMDVDLATNASGRGILIGIVDDGLQHAHPELNNNWNRLDSWDYNGPNQYDCSPTSPDDGHGTAAAAVAVGAAKNGHCGRGVAPNARVAGIRLIAAATTDATEAEALTRNAIAGIDIFSNSWGPADTGDIFGAAGRIVRLALARYVGAQVGRHGKGSIYTWASGNGRHNGDSCAYDGYANSPYVFPIGAVDHEGNRAWYSEGCSNLAAVAPSSGASKGIITADLLGNAGYQRPGECTTHFGGTSSAAPAAAGIIALLLEERPELTWRDILHIIARGATQVNAQDGSWHTNGRGIHHSENFGFGLLKLPPLLDAMRRHTLVPPMQMLHFKDDLVQDAVIPYSYSWTVHSSSMTFVEHVLVSLNIRHTDRGSVRVTLTSPSQRVSVLAPERLNDRWPNWPLEGWTLTSRAFFGESMINGKWTLNVVDVREPNAALGAVTRVQMNIMGF